MAERFGFATAAVWCVSTLTPELSMTLHRSALVALALSVGLPLAGVGTAEARVRNIVIRQVNSTSFVSWSRVIAVVGDDNVTNSVEASVESDAGDEDVPLVESDAWLHGAASIKALPKTDAALTLTLYDTASASLMSFSGTLGTDGSVTLTADATKDTGTTCDTASKTGCASDTSDTSTDKSLDVEVLAGEVFAAPGGYDVSLDLAGADTYAVAYAELTVTESDEVTTCNKETTECVTSGSTTVTKAEVGWDDIGAVWEGDLTVEPDGIIEVKVKTYDADGEDLESTKATLGLPWLDDGAGVNVLATDDDPLTSVGFLAGFDANKDGKINKNDSVWRLAVNSDGWSASSALPTQAKVELTNGGTITMSSFILLRLRKRPEILFQAWDHTLNEHLTDIVENPIYDHAEQESNPLFGLGGRISVSGGDFAISDVTVSDLSSPICSNGTCVNLITDGGGGFDLSVSTYGSDAGKLADDIELKVTMADDDGVELASDTVFVEFEEDITIVFANEVSFSQDPIGLDLSGKVSLLGAADKKGKQKTLAKGKFYGSFSRDGDGDLSLGGADKDQVSSQGSVVVAGEAVTFELTTDTDGDGVLNPPPLTPVFMNGSGTKNASNQASTKPELL